MRFIHSSNKECLVCQDKKIIANFEICTDKMPGENKIPNLKIHLYTKSHLEFSEGKFFASEVW